MKILAIETSCDETAAAVVEDGTNIISNVVASSKNMHEKYGGIVPEVAAREQLKCIIPVINEALAPFTHNQQFNHGIIQRHIDAIAVTIGPGLIGSLLVGVESAKTIAFVTKKPIIPVNHVLAHMYANFVHISRSDLDNSDSTIHRNTIRFPAVSLVVSGGHTELYLIKSMKELKWLGGTLDDAAGEAFDKTARLLGFGGRGGIAIQESAQKDSAFLRKDSAQTNGMYRVQLPRPMIDDETLNFSFSGLKTAILREVNRLRDTQQFNNIIIQQLSFEVQEAITDVLVAKTLKAAKMYNARSVLLSGGVASNLRLREKFSYAIQQCSNVALYTPPVSLCTDNAAYIGAYAYFRGKSVVWKKIDAIPDLSVEK